MSDNDNLEIATYKILDNMESDAEHKIIEQEEEEEPELIQDDDEAETVHKSTTCLNCKRKWKFDPFKSAKYNIPKPVVSSSYFSWSGSSDPQPTVFEANPLFLFFIKCVNCGEKVEIDDVLLQWEKKKIRDNFLFNNNKSVSSKIVAKK